MRKPICLFFLLIISFSHSFAQDEKAVKKGDNFFNAGNLYAAKDAYEDAYEIKKDNPYSNLQLAKCYLELSRPSKALEHANNAMKLTPKPTSEIYFVLAGALQLDMQFDKAIEYYQKSDIGGANRKLTSKLIKECEYGKKYKANPVDAKVTNAGPLVNTEHNEYLPYITADRSKLFFTSRRPGSTGGKKAEDGLLYEDIYMCYNKGGAWDTPQNVSSLNTDGHDACVGISEDGQTMFVYKGTNGGDIYMSELKGKNWSKPEPLPFNTIGFESTASLSPDGKTLYFVYAATSAGNRDIYVCNRTSNNIWSKPRKLESINTEFDEDSPFIHPDGKTLYFSSKGHSSMGGYDIFKCTKTGTGWSIPENLGYPINTPGDEIYFVLAADGKVGFYSSDKEGGLGKQDIYSIRMPVPEKEPELELLTGVVKDATTNQAIEADITITDNTTKEVVSKAKSNAEDGKYLVAIPCGKNYGIAIEKKGHLFHSENVNLPCTQGYKEIKKEIKLVEAKQGAKVVLKNIFFDTGKSDLRSESTSELLRLVKLLTENPTIRIEISGHTDNIGDAKINQTLSETRANSVMNFLISNGIAKTRLVAKGYGSSQPIDTNDSEAGRQNNRRTEFKIL
ncbi:MAG TPA: OmpA family protein [Cytophagaceae bacterium]|nr:OmpA family protein [Cytophagaceae bacterium]